MSLGDMERKLFPGFFQPSRYVGVKSTIATFSQGINRSLCESWDIYKSLLRKYPNHGFSDVAELNEFNSVLRP